MSLKTTEALFRNEMTLRNNSESEAALKEWLMVTWPPAVARRFLFYISELEVLKKAVFCSWSLSGSNMKETNYCAAFSVAAVLYFIQYDLCLLCTHI